MIDTIILRIHDLKLHSKLERYLVTEGIKGNSAYVNAINAEELMKQHTQYRQEMLKFGDTGKKYIKKNWNKLHIPSSHYNVAYSVDYQHDCIEFNMSIPKYLYGHNIAEFLISNRQNGFSQYKAHQVDYQAELLYKRLKTFILDFLKYELKYLEVKKYYNLTEYEQQVYIPIDLRYIEIARVDICYNQYFQTKEQALSYQKGQRKLMKSRARKDSNTMQDFATTVSYGTKAYYFKIYHKGSEYSKKDRKEHEKINKEKPNTFHIGYLQDTSDKILRYEISDRSDYMNRLYIYKVYRKNSKEHNKNFAKYRRLDSDYVQNKQLKHSKVDKQFYKSFKAHIQKKRKFMLEVDQEVLDDAKFSGVYKKFSVAHFSKELLKLMVVEFFNIVKEYQLKSLPDLDLLKERLSSYNNKIDRENRLLKMQKKPKKSRLNSTRILMIYNLLRDHTIDEIRKEEIFSKSTFYRYKADLKKLGIEKGSINENNLPTTEISYKEFYKHAVWDFKQFFPANMIWTY